MKKITKLKNGKQTQFRNTKVNYFDNTRTKKTISLNGDYYVVDAIIEDKDSQNCQIYYRICGIQLVPELCIGDNNTNLLSEKIEKETIASQYGYDNTIDPTEQLSIQNSIASQYTEIDIPVYTTMEDLNNERDPYSSNEEFETHMKKLFE